VKVTRIHHKYMQKPSKPYFLFLIAEGRKTQEL